MPQSMRVGCRVPNQHDDHSAILDSASPDPPLTASASRDPGSIDRRHAFVEGVSSCFCSEIPQLVSGLWLG
jgi:hypothetical protein